MNHKVFNLIQSRKLFGSFLQFSHSHHYRITLWQIVQCINLTIRPFNTLTASSFILIVYFRFNQGKRLSELTFIIPAPLLITLALLLSKRHFCTFIILKRIVAIVFLLVYLISVTELQQLVKLPVLLEHFMEHKQVNHNLSFVDFLSMHYSLQNEKDADYDRDMQLPFKSHDGCSVTFLSVFLHNPSNVLISKPVPASSCEYSEYSDAFLGRAYLASIWQPPKSC